MKRIFSSLLVAVFVIGTSSAFACPVKKLTGGLKDIVTSPLQVSDSVMAEKDHAKFAPFGVLGGLLKGTFYMGKQIVEGVGDIAMIPVDSVRHHCKK